MRDKLKYFNQMAVHTKEFTITRPSYLGGGSWIIKRATDITVIFGKNGSGKSLLLRELRNQDKDHFHYASPERSGEITFNAGLVTEELTGATRASRRSRNIAPTYREEVIARIQAFLAKRGNLRTASPPEDPTELENMINLLIPDFSFAIKDGNPPYELLRSVSSQGVSSVNDLSSGESEVLTVALDILLICAIWKIEGQNNGILLLDEPDTHLHPDLQQHLAKYLVKIVERYGVQILVATHSTTLLSALGYHGQEKTSVVYINNSVDEQNTIGFDRSLQEVAACLGGHALMGPLFGAPILLVEGDDDYNIWSQVPRFGLVNLAAIPCNGDEIVRYRRTLEKIFQSLLPNNSSPSGFMLRDADKQSRNTGFIHIKSLNLSCRESENLYLSDEVLNQMGISWEDAKLKIKSESHKYGNKEKRLNRVDKWDRKTHNLKNLIIEISIILDEKNVNWSLRVGRCIGKQKPNGQLADFLGRNIMNTFWPE